jgi:ribonuclease P/MRP protein subunit POP1
MSMSILFQARATELSSLHHTLSSFSGGNRRLFQTLPRHLRRRAMSHNVHRMPWRMRAAARREIEKMQQGTNVTAHKRHISRTVSSITCMGI